MVVLVSTVSCAPLVMWLVALVRLIAPPESDWVAASRLGAESLPAV